MRISALAGMVALVCAVASMSLAEPAALDTRGWQEEHARPWFVSESSVLPAPGPYGDTFFSNAMAGLPQEWVYTNQLGAWLPALAPIVKDAPQPLPATFWTSRANPTCWVGYVRFVYNGERSSAGRLISPWRCLRVNGMWRAETVGTPPGGTNILVTYLPHLRAAEDTNMVMLFVDADNATNEIPITLDGAGDISNLLARVGGPRPVSWRRVASAGESPEGLYWGVGEHALKCAHRTWWSPVAQEAVLRVGCDDAVRVWHNNHIVFEIAQRSGYVREEHGVRVRLVAGENQFMFVLVNGGGPAQLGARLYPSQAPIEGGVVLNDRAAYGGSQPIYDGQPAQHAPTGMEHLLDFLWLPVTNAGAPAALRQIDPACDCWRPQPLAAPLRPACELLRVIRVRDAAVVFAATNIRQYPIRLDLRGAAAGMYRSEAVWGGTTHARDFYHGNARAHLDATQRLSLDVARAENFFEPSQFCTMLADSFRGGGCSVSGTVNTVRAFISSRDGTMQPYLLRIPAQWAGVTGAPLIVKLKLALPMNVQDWCSSMVRRPEDTAGQDAAIVITPYARGARIYSGLAEGDVLDAIADAVRVTGADPARVYLCGDSMGGHGTWLIAARHPDLFAAIMPGSGYEFSFWHNLLNVPLWQTQGERDAPQQVQQMIATMQRNGFDAHITVEAGKLHTEVSWDTSKTVTEWMLTKRRVQTPTRVLYSTWGDVAGAYWVRDITPRRFGAPAMVDARYALGQSQGTITVQTHNVSALALDLRPASFASCEVWRVVLDETNHYLATPGSIARIAIDAPADVLGGTRPLRRLAGGVAGVFDHGFLFSFAGADTTCSTEAVAHELRDSMTGRGAWRFDSVFAVVADRALCAGLCGSNNVILCADLRAPGEFLTRHAAQLPFSLTAAGIAIGGRTGTQMVCVYPNPIASSRYLMTIMGVPPEPGLLQQARCDVVLDDMSGSFDAAWRNVIWDDASVEPQSHAAEHAAAVTEPAASGNMQEWLRHLPWGWLVPGAWLALLLGWGALSFWQRSRSTGDSQRH